MIPACLDLTKFIHCEIHFLCRHNLAPRKSAIIFDCEIYCCENLIKNGPFDLHVIQIYSIVFDKKMLLIFRIFAKGLKCGRGVGLYVSKLDSSTSTDNPDSSSGHSFNLKS